jgi:hypothetical protein
MLMTTTAASTDPSTADPGVDSAPGAGLSPDEGEEQPANEQGSLANSEAAAAAADEDPAPIPITWLSLPKWALKTYRAERRYYRRLGRGRRLTSSRLAASILPRIERPIFVVGAARSGTTFLGDCIGHLPEVSYHHEPPATKAAGRYVYEKLWGFRRSRWFFRTVYAWLLRVELDGNLRFCEKTPTNALLIPFLDRAFTGAQVIHIIRDGRDAAASHMRKPWLLESARNSGVREPGGYLHGPYAPWWVEPGRSEEFEKTSDAHRVIWAWRRYTATALTDGLALGPERYLELRYETLVTHPRDEGEKILDFLKVSRPASRASFLAAIDRAEEGSIGGWKRSFDAGQLAEIDADSGDLLRKLGYTAT